jgi:DNA-binding LytR/AlgR family response regulator
METRSRLRAASTEVREKISNMEMRLPADRFLRVHRSYLVNLPRSAAR